MQSEFIFPIDDAPTAQCHAATIAETPFGLVAAWFGGTEEKNADVNIWGAFNSGEGWSEPARIAWDEKYPCWNPVLFQPNDGPLMLFYKVGKNVRKWWGVVKTYEMGSGWSEPRKLGTDPKIGHLIGPAKNKPIQLADGSILCGSSTQHDGWKVHFERSADMGETWEVLPLDAGEYQAIQPAPHTFGYGTVFATCRTRQGYIISLGGCLGKKPWIHREYLDGINSGLDALVLNDGRSFVAYNMRDGARKSRHCLRISFLGPDPDDDWEYTHIALEDGQPGEEFSYPSMIEDRDGRIHVVYTWNRKTIKHVVLEV